MLLNVVSGVVDQISSTIAYLRTLTTVHVVPQILIHIILYKSV